MYSSGSLARNHIYRSGTQTHAILIWTTLRAEKASDGCIFINPNGLVGVAGVIWDGTTGLLVSWTSVLHLWWGGVVTIVTIATSIYATNSIAQVIWKDDLDRDNTLKSRISWVHQKPLWGKATVKHKLNKHRQWALGWSSGRSTTFPIT